MNNFWNNIARYPQFFISSMIGLILVILTPLKNLIKLPNLRILFVIFIIILIYFLNVTLKNMMGI